MGIFWKTSILDLSKIIKRTSKTLGINKVIEEIKYIKFTPDNIYRQINYCKFYTWTVLEKGFLKNDIIV